MANGLLMLILAVLVWRLFPPPPGIIPDWSAIRSAILTWLALGALGLGTAFALRDQWVAAGVCLLVLVGAWWLRDWLEARSQS